MKSTITPSTVLVIGIAIILTWTTFFQGNNSHGQELSVENTAKSKSDYGEVTEKNVYLLNESTAHAGFSYVLPVDPQDIDWD